MVGKFFACIDHKDAAYNMAAKRKKASDPEPETTVNFEPEVEEIEEVVVTGIRFGKMVDDE